MSHYDWYYESLAEEARKAAKKQRDSEYQNLKSQGFSDDEVRVILKAKEMSDNTTRWFC